MTPTYRERWVVPLLWWPAALGLATLVAAEVAGATPGSRVVPFLVVPPLTALLLAVGSRGSLVVDGGVLHVPGARIPIAQLDHGVVLDREAFRQQTGPLADPRAFVVSRPWLHSAVRLMLDDPMDPTPYWVVGTRRPQALLAALRSG
ncbi:MAG: DUF3093 domain-containing protein [Mycobacteriales bacterium]